MFEFVCQILQACRQIFHLLHVGGMGSHIRFGIPAQRFFPRRDALRLIFYLWCLFMQLIDCPFNSPLHFLALMQDMPNIPLMNTPRSDFTDSFSYRLPSIRDGSVPFYSLVLQRQEKKRPALPIHGYWWCADQHIATVRIHDIQIGFSSLAGILLIEY